MVDIIPFKGIRPKPEFAQLVSSVPYDVISSDEARKVTQQNSNSFLKVAKPEVDLDPSVDLYDDKVYQKGVENLRSFVSSGIYTKDPKPYFYIYQQKMGEHEQIGLVAAASVEDYIEDNIKKHEFTREDKELDRTRHIDMLNANTEPIFLTYEHQDNLDAIISAQCTKTPVYKFIADDGIHHVFWVVDDHSVIQEISEIFKNINVLYVADGHHRSAASVRVCQKRKEVNPLHFGNEPYNYFLSVIFPDNQMQILAYNRVIQDLNGLTSDEFMTKIEALFDVSAATEPAPTKKHSFGMYLDNKWYTLKAKENIVEEDHPVKSLDVYILQEYVLNPILGIENPRKDKRIDFAGGIRGAKYLEDSVAKNNGGVAFFLYPVDIKSLMAIADSGEVMPPKSTWFEPKLRSGLVLHSLV